MARSFGMPIDESDGEEQLEPIPVGHPAAGRIALAVDLVLTDESLEGLEEQLTSLIARAVIAGFAAAAMEQQN